MLDELISAVARSASLSPEQAAKAVTAMLHFFTARLPSAWVGELHSRLQTPAHAATGTPASDMAGKERNSPS